MTPSDSQLRRVLAAVALTLFVVDLDFFALNLALPRMAEDLGTTTTNLQWVVSGYMLALGAFLIPGGRLGDILGRRRIMLVGIAVFGGASLGAGLVSSPGAVIGFRIIQGLGAAMLFPVSIAVLTNAFPPERRQRALGNAYGLAAIGTAAGPFVGGLVTQHLGWRWVLLINVPIAVAAFALTFVSVTESRDPSVPRRIDMPGLLAVALGIASITIAVDRGDAWGWDSPRTLGLAVLGLGLLAAFVAIERRVRWPLVDLVIFRNRPYVLVTLAGMVANTIFCITVLVATIYTQQVRGLSPLVSGIVFLAPAVAVAIGGPLSGRLAAVGRPLVVMASLLGIGAVGLLALSYAHAWAGYVAAFALFGAGIGTCWSFVTVATQSVVAPERAGEASGVTLAIVVGVAGLAVACSASVLELLATGSRDAGGAIELMLRVMAVAALVIAAIFAVLAARGLGRAPAPSTA